MPQRSVIQIQRACRKAEPSVEQETGVDHDSMASTSNDATNMGCNDKDTHNSISEPRKTQQYHNRYYTIDGTVQQGQFVKTGTQTHCADEMMYAEEIVEPGYPNPKVTVTLTQQPRCDEKSEQKGPGKMVVQATTRCPHYVKTVMGGPCTDCQWMLLPTQMVSLRGAGHG